MHLVKLPSRLRTVPLLPVPHAVSRSMWFPTPRGSTPIPPAGPAGAGSIRTRQGVTNAAEARASVNVQAVGIGKTFAPTTIQETDYSTLTITLRNPTGGIYNGVGCGG